MFQFQEPGFVVIYVLNFWNTEALLAWVLYLYSEKLSGSAP